MSNPRAPDAAFDGLLLDARALQRDTLDQETRSLARHTPWLLAAAHTAVGCEAWWFGAHGAVLVHLALAGLAVVFAWQARRGVSAEGLNRVGALLILAGMAMFTLVRPGATAVFIYVLMPIPAFRILGLREGMLTTLACLALATLSFASEVTGATAIPLAVRVNTLIAFGLAAGFGASLERLRQRSNATLASSLGRLRTLHGLIPICAWCKRVRESDESWHQIESVLRSEGILDFTHGICATCAEQNLPPRKARTI